MQHELRYMKISYQFLSRSHCHLKLGIQKHWGFFFKITREYPSRSFYSYGDLPFEIFFPGISALIDSQESQITKENRGGKRQMLMLILAPSSVPLKIIIIKKIQRH